MTKRQRRRGHKKWGSNFGQTVSESGDSFLICGWNARLKASCVKVSHSELDELLLALIQMRMRVQTAGE